MRNTKGASVVACGNQYDKALTLHLAILRLELERLGMFVVTFIVPCNRSHVLGPTCTNRRYVAKRHIQVTLLKLNTGTSE